MEQALLKLYGEDLDVQRYQIQRYQNITKLFHEKFNQDGGIFFSAPGRTEIGGNHTDHNHGCVLAAAISLDSIALAKTNNNNKVVIYSQGYEQPFEVDLRLKNPVIQEKNTTHALIRGIAAKLEMDGYKTGGFNAVMASDVLPGSGLSSSAAIEVLITSIFNSLYNQSLISSDHMALIGQYAENVFFGKPCGLMDQTASAYGGVVFIDFKDPQLPVVEQIDFNLDKEDYSLLVVNSGGDHSDLTEDYASIPREMKRVAEVLGKKVARDLTRSIIIENIAMLREKTSDRAVLRALHFVEENLRAQLQREKLKTNQFKEFLDLINDSGLSSYCYLQNVFSPKNQHDQSIAIALEMTTDYIKNIGEGACRVHGGGFAGTILAFLPKSKIKGYISLMGSIFGNKCISILNFRKYGAVCLSEF